MAAAKVADDGGGAAGSKGAPGISASRQDAAQATPPLPNRSPINHPAKNPFCFRRFIGMIRE